MAHRSLTPRAFGVPVHTLIPGPHPRPTDSLFLGPRPGNLHLSSLLGDNTAHFENLGLTGRRQLAQLLVTFWLRAECTGPVTRHGRSGPSRAQSTGCTADQRRGHRYGSQLAYWQRARKTAFLVPSPSKGLFLRVALDTDFIHLTPREMNQNLLEGLQTRIPAGGLHSAASIPTGQLGAFLSGVRGRRQTGGLRPHRSPHRPGWQSPCSKSTSRKSSSFLVALAPLPMLGRPCTGWSPPRPGSQPGVLKQGCLCPHRAPGSIGEFRLSRGGGLDWHLAAGGQGRSSTP